MSKYIKWELISELRKKKFIFGFIAIVYLLVLIFPEDSQVMRYLLIPTSFILIGTFFLTFVAGAKRTMDSYQNKTFLLESMIPLSPNKILLAKYILAILANITYCIIFILGLAVCLSKADINLIKEIIKALFELELDEWETLIRVFIFLLSSSVATTALTTLVFMFYKSVFPNMKGIKIVSFISSGVVMDILLTGILSGLIKMLQESDIVDIYFSLLFMVITVVCYFISVYFVKEKLEIYN